MKSRILRTFIRLFLSILFTLTITLGIFAAPCQISVAAPISQQIANTECGSDVLTSLDKFIEETGRTAGNYITVGITYLSCGNLEKAEKQFEYALELAREKNDKSFAELVAQYGLLEIDYLSGKITQNEKEALLNELYSKLPKRGRIKKFLDRF